jgi:cytosine/adenosine deaminase-related metal-dependent hydrolase
MTHETPVLEAKDIVKELGKGAGKVMALKGYGLAPGCAADLLLADGDCLTEAVVSHAPRRLVVKRGRVVARDGNALVAP